MSLGLTLKETIESGLYTWCFLSGWLQTPAMFAAPASGPRLISHWKLQKDSLSVICSPSSLLPLLSLPPSPPPLLHCRETEEEHWVSSITEHNPLHCESLDLTQAEHGLITEHQLFWFHSISFANQTTFFLRLPRPITPAWCPVT